MARFRAYTSDSSDEDESSNQNVNEPASDEQPRIENNSAEHSEQDDSDSDSHQDEENNEVHEIRAPLTSPPQTIVPWAQQIGVDSQRMHVMQTSFFRMPEEAAALKALNQPPPARLTVRKSIPALNRKHSRDSEGDGLRGDPRERASFAHDIEPVLHRPFRKFARVETTSSTAAGHEGAFFDAGLAFGRSFRVGWGPGGTLVHAGKISIPNAPPSAALSEKLLQHHLSHTPITPDDAGVPLAYPSLYPAAPQASTSQPSLNFSSFSSLFPTTDNSAAAQLFRLGSALFDPIDLQLPKAAFPDTTDVTPDVRNRIALLRRKAALSKWLTNTVEPEIQSDLQALASSSTPSTSSTQRPSTSRPDPHTASDEAFIYLTGHQVRKAAEIASDAGYLKLATLISQAGGDAVFRADILSQLKIWEAEKVLPFIEKGIKKVYTLLAGLLEKGEDKDVDVCANLDWKRVFGLCLWYGEPVTASIADVFDSYETLVKNSGDKVARPFPPWYDQSKARGEAESSSVPTWSSPPHPQLCNPEDPLYALIRLHADPALSLSHVLNPTSFGLGASRFDWSMCWHMYIILSRVMRVRDFGDREELHSRARSRPKLANGFLSDDEGEDDGTEGHSPSADLLASSYASQLEAQGMLQEAVFVLLHIEGSPGREKAIKDLLARSAPKIDEWTTRGLVGSLKIPLSWVNEAKALYALDTGDIYDAYELYLSAGLYGPAHNIAVLELAPDTILRRDLDHLRDIFERFEGKEDKIDGWSIRGKVLLDYSYIMQRVAGLQEAAPQDRASPHTSGAQELDELTRQVPKILGLLPDVLSRRRSTDPRHTAALEHITKDLIGLIEKTKPSILSQIQQSTLSGADEVTKLKLVKGIGYSRFLKSIEIGVYA